MRKPNKIIINGKPLDEILANHAEWHKSEGTKGQIAQLWGADLRKAHLCDANLSHADLRGANLLLADLYKADLCGADLSGADLRETNLLKANLSGANLRLANLRRAKLGGALNISEAKGIDTADFKDATLDEETRHLLEVINKTVEPAENEDQGK